MDTSWDAKAYEQGFGFVPAYGEAVIDLIEACEGATCLDLGCGNGTLTAELAARGLAVQGVDASPDMVARARELHPELCFTLADARSFDLGGGFDVVFSNAMLHWVAREDQPTVLARVAAALRPGGQFVFECGGHGCCAQIHAALAEAFFSHGLPYEIPFCFPTVGEYAPLVEGAGLRVSFAALFDRPTALAGEGGMEAWIRMFVKRPFEPLDDGLAGELIIDAVRRLRNTPLYHDGSWTADYVRLRMKAVKLG